jgi:hypothetical protein
MIKPSKRVMSAAAVAGLVCLAAGVLHAARTQQGSVMYVGEATWHSSPMDIRGTTQWDAHTHVKIVDDANPDVAQPVAGAKVTVKFTGCKQGNGSATTGNDGYAFINAGRRKCGCTYMYEVTGVNKSGWTWIKTDPLPSASATFTGCD